MPYLFWMLATSLKALASLFIFLNMSNIMATHSSILAWKIPWTEEPGGLQSMGSKESDTTERLHLNATTRLLYLQLSLIVESFFGRSPGFLSFCLLFPLFRCP